MLRHSFFAILWTLVLGTLCGLPGNSFPDLSLWALLRFDSFAHAFVFALFALLWAIAFCKQQEISILRRYPIWSAFLFSIIYGVLIEFLQYAIFFRRSADFLDMVADAFGGFIGVIVFWLIYRPILKQVRQFQT
ncbi:MAG: VanZ family protein [Sphingobacteriales bacterium]|nr:MAG: VanZ family protein [Sphingobacteriales bacterium]